MEDTEEGWKAAERVVREHFARQRSTVCDAVRERIPYLFGIACDPPGCVHALVDQGRYIDEESGLPALATYLQHIDARERPLQVKEYLSLLGYFKAWPEATSFYHVGFPPHVELTPNPAFVIAYAAQSRGPAHGDRILYRYTLDVPPDYQLKWSLASVYVERAASVALAGPPGTPPPR